MSIIFTPSVEGDYLDTLEVPFNLPLRDNPTLVLRGTGVKPTIAASVSDLDFEMVLLEEPQMLSFDIVNNGTDTLKVDSLMTDSTDFTATPVETVAVIPGDTVRARVIFTPEAGGAITDTLIINSNDPDRPQLLIPLKGSGLTYPSPLYSLNSMGLVTTLGTDLSIEQKIVNDGDYTMEFDLSVDDNASSWLSVSPDTGEVSGHDTLTMVISVTNTEAMGEGLQSGKFFLTTNSGKNLQNTTESIEIDLKVLPSGVEIVSGSVEIPEGDPGLVTMLDNNGNPLNVSLDFSSGDGGTVTVTYYPTAPHHDTVTKVIDPDSLIGRPIFGNIYWEVESELSEDATVDISFGLYGLTGVQSLDKLRLGRRTTYSGKRVDWDLVPVSQIQVDENNRTITALNQTEFSQWLSLIHI